MVEVREVPTPVPKDDEVLVRVRATTVASGDHRVRAFDLPKGFKAFGRLGIGFRGPRQPILGTDLAGDVEAVGANVTLFQPGDGVMAAASATHAEHACVGQDKAIVSKPPNLSFEHAAAVIFGGLTAVYYLRELAHLQPNQRIAIYGASGSVGTASVQLAKHLGAHVVGVSSGVNQALVRSLGADEVLDYTKESFLEEGGSYDVIFDTVGKTTYKQCKPALRKGGVYLPAVATLGQFLRTTLFRNGRVRAGVALGTKERMSYLAELAAKGNLRPVIDRTYSLDQIVEAHRHVDTGHKRGNIIVKPGA